MPAGIAVPDGFVLDVTVRSHGWYDLPPFLHLFSKVTEPLD